MIQLTLVADDSADNTSPDTAGYGVVESGEWPCPMCEQPLTRMPSRFGKLKFWWGCSSFPACNYKCGDKREAPDYIVARAVLTEHKCGECGQRLIKRQSRRDNTKYWYGCKQFPQCRWRCDEKQGEPDYATGHATAAALPSKHKCPHCSKVLVRLHNKQRRDRFWYACQGYKDRPACGFACPEKEGAADLANGYLRPVPSDKYCCPACRKGLIPYKDATIEGLTVHRCSGWPDCDRTYDDNDGVPVDDNGMAVDGEP